MIEFQLQKATNMSGTNFGPFDNNVSVVLRNMTNNLTQSISTVSCAGQTTCSFSVSVSDLINTLGLSGLDSLDAALRSPPGSTYVGNTGQVSLQQCY